MYALGAKNAYDAKKAHYVTLLQNNNIIILRLAKYFEIKN
jgi:hypothetical protein